MRLLLPTILISLLAVAGCSDNGTDSGESMMDKAKIVEGMSGSPCYIDGKVIGYQNPQIRPIVGYVPDFMGAYDDMVVSEYLEFFAAAYRIRGPGRRQVCDQMLDLVDLDFKRNAFANTLSRGQTQRLGLARVLLHDPQVLLLDEPHTGLDQDACVMLDSVLRQVGALGRTVVMTSHDLARTADLASRFDVLSRGKIVASARRDEMDPDQILSFYRGALQETGDQK